MKQPAKRPKNICTSQTNFKKKIVYNEEMKKRYANVTAESDGAGVEDYRPIWGSS